MCTYQDYSQPIISNLNFMIYMNMANKVFDPQWRFLAALRGIDCTRDDPGLTAYKKRQVFIQLLHLQRVANYKDLAYWALHSVDDCLLRAWCTDSSRRQQSF